MDRLSLVVSDIKSACMIEPYYEINNFKSLLFLSCSSDVSHSFLEFILGFVSIRWI